jgi:hypothetical protein
MAKELSISNKNPLETCKLLSRCITMHFVVEIIAPVPEEL